MARLGTDFPDGLEHRILYDTTEYITQSLKEVVSTLIVAVLLVIFTVYIARTGILSILPLYVQALSTAGSPVGLLTGLSPAQALLIAFALSFSSTVFVAKALEERGEVTSLHGRIALSILIVQDLIAVGFLAASTGKWP